MADNQRLTLLELNRLVRDIIELKMPDEYWVEAEISEIREVKGHCYMGLIQKDIYNNTPIAKASATCWRNNWNGIRARFIKVTNQMPQPGMKVLLKVSAQFHENYGFSWIVSDIDPSFTLGDMAAKREKILRQLKMEGVINDNKGLPLPMFIQRIAVISSATAAGYGDFCNHLLENEYGYYFHTQLFESTMQGEGVEASVIAALDKIIKKESEFDCIVITRGGGATSDLSGFDTLDLARNIANCPLPIITAIGHDRDESVIDIISNTRLKTPTAAAAFFIDRLREVEIRIDDANQRIIRTVQKTISAEKLKLNNLSLRIPALFAVVESKQRSVIDKLFMRAVNASENTILKRQHHIDKLTQLLQPTALRVLRQENHRMELLVSKVSALDPQRLLDRGYSITTYQGRAVKDPALLPSGSVIETRLKKGKLTSKVIKSEDIQ